MADPPLYSSHVYVVLLLLLPLHCSIPDHECVRLVDVGVVVAHDVVEAAVQQVHRMRDWRAHVLLDFFSSRSSPW